MKVKKVNNQKTDEITIVGVGDISPNREDPPSIFQYCKEAFDEADIVFGQMEGPLSKRGTPMFVPHAPCRLDPKNILALTNKGANFDVMSFACNHAMDYGWDAFYDTLDILKKHNIRVIGAGRNIYEARKPAIIERKGTKIGFLAYLSILPLGTIAEESIPGCAPLRAHHYYQQVDYQPGTPPRIITYLYQEDKEKMLDDIRKLRNKVDVLVVSTHCGIHFVPAEIAMYQKEIAYSAIDSGADLILQHHGHILKGIEIYKGKAIFYGLGNFALEHSQDFPGKLKGFGLIDRTLAREHYGIKQELGFEKHKFQKDALKTIIAKAYIQKRKITKVKYIPALINPNLEPEIVKRESSEGKDVFDYVEAISENQNLNVKFSWEGNEVLVHEYK